MKAYNGVKLDIHGFTDDVVTRNINQTLSEMRAGAVMEYLFQKGEMPKYVTVGHGDDPLTLFAR
jgi:outer membrane protein OmpA-like peptidoglycan-associated protein